LAIEVWCWPFEERIRRWCGNAGHAGIRIGQTVYDFHPARHDGANVPVKSYQDEVPRLTMSMARVLEKNPLDPELNKLIMRGCVLDRTQRDVANEMAVQFDVYAQCLQNHVQFDKNTGVFKEGLYGVLPKLHAYRVEADVAAEQRLTAFIMTEQRRVPDYHIARHNCTHFVRRSLAVSLIKVLDGDGWQPRGDHPGNWRPDKFDALLQEHFGPPKEVALALEFQEGTRRAGGNSFYWKELSPISEFAG
jgi:hypothetical protein